MVYFYIQLGVCACVWGCPWVAIKWEKWNYSTCKPYFCKVEMVFEIYEENSVVLPLIFNWEKISPSCKDSVIDHRFPVVPSVHGVQRNMIDWPLRQKYLVYLLSFSLFQEENNKAYIFKEENVEDAKRKCWNIIKQY